MSFSAMGWSLRLACCGYLLASSHATLAAPSSVAPNLRKLDGKQFCSVPGGPASKQLLARAIIKSYKIPVDLIDWNDTGIGYEQYAQAVSKFLCGSPVNSEQAKKCFSPDIGPNGMKLLTSDAANQEQMVQEVNNALRQAAAGRDDFDLVLTKITLRFHRTKPATALDVQKQPILAIGNDISLTAQVFSSDPVFFEVTCVAPTKETSGTVSPSLPSSSGPPTAPGATPPGSPGQSFVDRIRVRAKSDDLWVPRDADAFAGLPSASLAIVNDNIAKKNTFDLHLTVGYVLPAWQLGSGDVVLEAIPFVKYDRDFISGPNAPLKASNINNVAFGLQENLTFPLASTFYSRFAVQPEFVHSLRTDADVAKLRLIYEPEPLLPFIGFVAPTPIPSFSATAYARGILNITRVVNSGSDPTLSVSNNFAQGGVQMGGALFNKDETSMLNGVSIPIDYTNLRGLSGPLKSIHLLQTALNYTFPKTKYITVGLSYTSGRNLDTFEQQKLYKASLGLKY
jgi:hypothetical protein